MATTQNLQEEQMSLVLGRSTAEPLNLKHTRLSFVFTCHDQEWIF